jgi:hypothetical protein
MVDGGCACALNSLASPTALLGGWLDGEAVDAGGRVVVQVHEELQEGVGKVWWYIEGWKGGQNKGSGNAT